jgi:hypothetical protein
MVYIGFNLREITAFNSIYDLADCPLRQLSPEEVKELLKKEYVSCCNITHKPVLNIIKRRFQIELVAHSETFLHRLHKGDKVIIIIVTGVRRLGEYERYTVEELRKARIFFRQYRVNY